MLKSKPWILNNKAYLYGWCCLNLSVSSGPLVPMSNPAPINTQREVLKANTHTLAMSSLSVGVKNKHTTPTLCCRDTQSSEQDACLNMKRETILICFPRLVSSSGPLLTYWEIKWQPLQVVLSAVRNCKCTFFFHFPSLFDSCAVLLNTLRMAAGLDLNMPWCWWYLSQCS